MRRRWTIWIAMALPGWLALCGARPIPYGGELTVTLPPAEELDPARLETISELVLAASVHETVVRLAADGSVEPMLAREARPSDDFREWTLLLRADECFHNGSPLDARDVVQSWERLLRRETGSPHWWLLSMVDGALDFRQGRIRSLRGLETINRVTLKVRLTRSFPDFPQALAALPAAVLPSSWMARRVATPPPGAGPFMLPRTLASPLELRPFSRHVRGRPFLERLLYRAPLPPERERVLLTPGSPAAGEEAPASQQSGEQASEQSAEPLEAAECWTVFLYQNPVPTSRWPEEARPIPWALLDRGALAEAVPDARLPDGGEEWRPQEPAASLAREEVRSRVAAWTVRRWGVPPMAILLIHPETAQRLIASRLRADAARAGVVLVVQEKNYSDYVAALNGPDWDLRLVEMLPISADEELKGLQMLSLLGGEEAVREADGALRQLPPGEERVSRLREIAAKHAGRNIQPLISRGLRFSRQADVEDVRFRGVALDLSWCWLRSPGEKDGK
ncbi:MAG: hypothetical protein GYA21_09970 [Myxococcales bacterium]|nr:hypothetical protein [Myxococcales bacterium]